MIKSILILATGDVFDEAVLETALRVAQPAAAHIELRYFCKGLGAGTQAARQVGWAIGSAAAPALAVLDERIEQQSRDACAVFTDLCRRKGVALVNQPHGSTAVTASWHPSRDSLASIAYHARHVDLVVTGRPGHGNGLTRSHVETLLSAGGRPVLIAPSVSPPSVTGTAFVCWKESPEAARALAAALPLLTQAQRVVVATVDEGSEQAPQPPRAVAGYLAFHGIAAETRLLPRNAPVAAVLAAAADAHESDLVVLGAYGHSKAREVVFGGCTRAFLDAARASVLMMQ